MSPGEEDQIIEAGLWLLHPRAFGNAAAYLFGLAIAGVPITRAAIVAAIAYLTVRFHYGARLTEHGGIILLFFSMLVWIQLLPPIDRWRGLINSFFPA